MVVKVFCGEDFSNYEHEWNQFIELYETIKEKYEKSNQHIYFLVNFSLSNAQIDVLLLTENGIAIIDLKSYQGKIIGSENGSWKVVTENEKEMTMNKNLFLQLKAQKFAFLDKLNTIRKGNFERIERVKLGRIKCWGYFENGSTYDINQVGEGTHIWFDVVTSDDILKKMRFINAGYLLKLKDMNAIVNGLNLTEYPFEEEGPLNEKNGSGQEKTIEIEETKSEDVFSTSINEYLNSIINEENTIINDDVEFGISNVYTELSAKIPAKKILPISLKYGEQENSREEESEVLDLVEKEKNLIISGASGSGKTITLKWLNLIFSKKYQKEGNCSIPLYIELNSYKEGNFYDYIKIKAKEKRLPESKLKLLLNGKLIFLIDGFDLLSSTESFTPNTEISNFISEYSECRYVISSRPGFFKGIQNKFKISELKELDENNIQSFVNNYIPDEELANIITDQILNDDKFISLFKNPMMLYLAIIVIISRLEDGINITEVLPSERSSLYGVFISELFKHYKRKGKSLNADKTQILDTLTNLYFKLQCQNDVDCKYKYAIEIALKQSDDKTPKSAKNILDDLFNIGLLSKDESRNDIEDYVKYGIHQSFLEYFAALKLTDCFESGYDLSPVFKHPKWEDVVIFAAEMFDYPDDFIDKIIDSHELDLASKCAQNASKDIKEKLCKFLAEKIDDRFISERTDAIKSLRRLGDIGISLVFEASADEIDENMFVLENEIGIIKTILHNICDDVLGEIKFDKPLINALDDEDYNVRKKAAHTLGKIKSDEAVKPLINTLSDDNAKVRWSAAYALEEIITTENKYLLEPLLDSENEYVANTSYDILKKIDQNERSEKNIKLKKNSISRKDDPNKPDGQELPCGEPAEKGLKDPYIGIFVDRLKSIKEPTSIVDYGCGQGKLLCALTTLPDVAIENISYFGVDKKTRCRYTSRLTAEKYGLFNLFKAEPEFLKPKDFYAKDIRLDYALLMHAMHEIKLLDLIEIIYSISVKLKMGGQIFILDQRELIETERSFVLWDDKKDFEELFLDSGLEISQRFFDTGSNKKLSSIEVKKVQDDCFSREIVTRNCMKVYETKKDTVSNRIDIKGISYEELQELNTLYSNISKQIDKYNKSVKLA